jgi:hypothetical protein
MQCDCGVTACHNLLALKGGRPARRGAVSGTGIVERMVRRSGPPGGTRDLTGIGHEKCSMSLPCLKKNITS